MAQNIMAQDLMPKYRWHTMSGDSIFGHKMSADSIFGHEMSGVFIYWERFAQHTRRTFGNIFTCDRLNFWT